MFVPKTGNFLEKEFLSKGVNGRKIDLDDMIDPSLPMEDTTTKIVPEPSSVVGAEEKDHHDIHNDHDIHDDNDDHDEDPILPRRSTRVRYTTQFYEQFVN